VIVLERTNAMHVVLPEKMDLITIDTAWTKQEKIIPNAFNNLKPDGKIIALIKPHYEADRKFLDHGRLQDDKVEEVLSLVKQDIQNCGGEVLEIVESPILGKKGENKEFLALIARRASI
jgi:23S rRNA (cytidine1920-2'-O)/16S rRNA (cytidine1409-2'-O)-methyltransferase